MLLWFIFGALLLIDIQLNDWWNQGFTSLKLFLGSNVVNISFPNNSSVFIFLLKTFSYWKPLYTSWVLIGGKETNKVLTIQ